LDIAGPHVQPSDIQSESLTQGQPVTFYGVFNHKRGNVSGNGLVYLRFVDKVNGAESQQTVSAQPVPIDATNFSVSPAALHGQLADRFDHRRGLGIPICGRYPKVVVWQVEEICITNGHIIYDENHLKIDADWYCPLVINGTILSVLFGTGEIFYRSSYAKTNGCMLACFF